MIFNKKGGGVMDNLVLLIILLVTVAILVDIFIFGFSGFLKSESADRECSYFLSNINGKPAFFTDLKTPNLNLFKAVSAYCPSRSVKVKSDDISPAVDLIESCWKKANSGNDFLPANMQNNGVCLYCGKIESKDSIVNFGAVLDKKLKSKRYGYLLNNSETSVNLNNFFLRTPMLPDKLDESNSASVFFMIFKPEVYTLDPKSFIENNVLIPISEQFGNLGTTAKKLNYHFTSSSIPSFSAIIVSDQKKYANGEVLNSKKGISSEKCVVIIPKETN